MDHRFARVLFFLIVLGHGFRRLLPLLPWAVGRLDATPFDVEGAELGHHGKECTFEAILKRYDLARDPALALLGRIVNGADTDNTLWNQPEAPGLCAITEGFRHVGLRDDHEINADQCIVYDALYQY